MKTKILSMALALSMVLSVLPFMSLSSAAAEQLASGKCGTNLTWSLDSGYTLTISGTGAMTDYNYITGAPWYRDYCDSIKEVVIESGVTSIGNYAFYYCDALESVTIPEGVTSIGNYAFYSCIALERITIPEGVTSIGELAFTSCRALKSIIIPQSLTSIGVSAFLYCAALTTVYYGGTAEDWNKIGDNDTFPVEETIHYIRDSGNCGAEGDGSNATWVIYDNYTLVISGTGAMADYTARNKAPWNNDYRNSIKEVVIENGITNIGNCAFQQCYSLASVAIPKSVTSIGSDAFSFCQYYLKSIVIPEGVTTIGEDAFYYCLYLKSIVIPKSVTSIGEYAVYFCNNLDDIYYNGTAADWASITISDYNAKLTDATKHYAPSITTALAWSDTEGFGINFNIADGWANSSYTAEVFANGNAADAVAKHSFTSGDEGFSLAPSSSNDVYMWKISDGSNVVSKALTHTSVYALVLGAIADGGFNANKVLHSSQTEAIKNVLANGGIYIKNGELGSAAAQVMTLSGSTLSINDNPYAAGLRFPVGTALTYTSDGGATTGTITSDDGKTLEFPSLQATDAVFLSADVLEFIPEEITETEAAGEANAELDFEEVL